MTEHEQIQEFLKRVSVPTTCGIRGKGVACKICFVFTASDVVNDHAPNCCVQIFYNPRPVDIVLFCPNCGLKHIDKPHGDWTNPPHKSHECQICGCIWRPADVPTNGVERPITVGTSDNFTF